MERVVLFSFYFYDRTDIILIINVIQLVFSFLPSPSYFYLILPFLSVFFSLPSFEHRQNCLPGPYQFPTAFEFRCYYYLRVQTFRTARIARLKLGIKMPILLYIKQLVSFCCIILIHFWYETISNAYEKKI